MTTSLLLAQVIGLYLLLEGLVILTQKKFIINVVTDMSKHKALMSVTAAMVTILGLLIILNHNVWEMSWQVIPTIIGWVLLIKGVLLFLTPKLMLARARKFAHNRNLAVLVGVAALIIGAYLVYIGFVVGA